MANNDRKTQVYLDTETIPEQPEDEARQVISENITPPGNMKSPATISDWENGRGKYAGAKDIAIEEGYRKTALNGAKGQICSIAYAVKDDKIRSFSLYGYETETDILNAFIGSLSKDLLKENRAWTPFFIGHRLAGFDLKFLYHRFVINKIDPGYELPFYGRNKHDYYDTMVSWSGSYNLKDSISQNDLCKALGIEGKPDGIDGSKVWDFFKEGRIEEIEAYNRDDVDKVRQIYKRLNFV